MNLPNDSPLLMELLDTGDGELAQFRFASVLAQIELSSCFRNDVEPLFSLLTPTIHAIRCL